jgi:uncharacterized protein (DUF1697 family)
MATDARCSDAREPGESISILLFSEQPSRRLRSAGRSRPPAAYAGKPVGVLVHMESELAQVLANNPFPDAAPNRTVVIFLDEPPMGDALERITGKNGEDVRPGQREIYAHYGDGMAYSKPKVPDAKAGTARNINTVSKLAGMVAEV